MTLREDDEGPREVPVDQIGLVAEDELILSGLKVDLEVDTIDPRRNGWERGMNQARAHIGAEGSESFWVKTGEGSGWSPRFVRLIICFRTEGSSLKISWEDDEQEERQF